MQAQFPVSLISSSNLSSLISKTSVDLFKKKAIKIKVKYGYSDELLINWSLSRVSIITIVILNRS